jgi:hypothetical protein
VLLYCALLGGNAAGVSLPVASRAFRLDVAKALMPEKDEVVADDDDDNDDDEYDDDDDAG